MNQTEYVTLSFQFADSSIFSVLGDTWAMRLGVWSNVPEGQLLVDAEMDSRPIQMFARMKNGSLYFEGGWQQTHFEISKKEQN